MKKLEFEFKAEQYFDIGLELLPRIFIGYYQGFIFLAEWLWFGATIEIRYVKTTKK